MYFLYDHDVTGFKGFYFFNVYKSFYNVLKYIYVITQEGKVIVEHESMLTHGQGQRHCHSELAGGLPVQAAGELVFEYKNYGFDDEEYSSDDEKCDAMESLSSP